MKKEARKIIALGLALAMATGVLTGCRFGFASVPDDPNGEVVE